MTATTDAYYNVTSRYTYDGEGRRVRRNIGGQEVWQVYGVDGELIAEYAASASATSPQKEYGYRSGELLITATGGSTSPVNLALNKPAIQSTTFSDFPASLAVDGNTNGDFNGAHTSSATDYSYQGWWQVDLQSSQTINTIKVWPRTDCCTEHLANYYVLVSDQPFQSTDLNATINQSGVSSYSVYGYTYSPTIVNINRTGRYIRVQRSDSQYLVLAEVEVLGQQQGAGNADVEWIVTDQLGTPRMIADQTGSLAGIKRHDYLPFGEELFAGVGSRTTQQGYVADSVRQQFTGKERDNETGLDYFGARYLSSTQGRFISPDPLLSSGTIYNPQTWNRYAYTLNNPLKWTDPFGLYIWSASLGGNETDEELRRGAGKDKKALKQANSIIDKRNDFRNALTAAGRARNALPAGAERDSVTAALASYGAEGVANGVSVGRGQLADNVAAEARVSFETDPTEPFATRAVVAVVLNEKGSGNLTVDVAHEGRHVADGQAFAAALTADVANGYANAAAGPLNFTRFDREVRAYNVSSSVAQGLGLDNLSVGRREIWNRGWSQADRATLRSRAIQDHLRESSTYHLTPQNPGERYIPRQ